MADLLVLGGGPAGLAAAWRAARRGFSVTLLERAPAVGGLAASFDVAGIRVDHGSHRLHPATPAPLLADLRDLLGEDLQTRRRHGRLHLAQRWVGFPLRPGELVRTLPPRLVAGLAREAATSALTAPLRRALRQPPSPTYAGVLRAGLGPTAYDALYAPYARKLWGLPGEQIDADQARRRVTADTPWKLARRVLQPGGRRQGHGPVFHYPRRGFGQLVEALADAAVTGGADVRVGTEVVGLHVLADRVTARLADGSTVTARRAFSTLPLPLLARITRPAPPSPVTEAADRLRSRAMVLVYLVVAGRPWTAYDAHYLPGPETPVTRISEPTNYRDSADDPADHTVLCAEIPCDPADPLWTASDDVLGAVVTDTFARTGLPGVRLLDVVVRRAPRVYPVYAVGYADALAAVDRWAVALPTVTTFGRLGSFAHDNTHHALAMAYDAVEALGDDEDGRWDAAAWAAARGRHAGHVVED